ncbi:hypothetical protein BV22DRAFT_1036901, partial [Leucogyrophana mollusca]
MQQNLVSRRQSKDSKEDSRSFSKQNRSQPGKASPCDSNCHAKREVTPRVSVSPASRGRQRTTTWQGL